MDYCCYNKQGCSYTVKSTYCSSRRPRSCLREVKPYCSAYSHYMTFSVCMKGAKGGSIRKTNGGKNRTGGNRWESHWKRKESTAESSLTYGETSPDGACGSCSRTQQLKRNKKNWRQEDQSHVKGVRMRVSGARNKMKWDIKLSNSSYGIKMPRMRDWLCNSGPK
jgi:hypothetical protein